MNHFPGQQRSYKIPTLEFHVQGQETTPSGKLHMCTSRSRNCLVEAIAVLLDHFFVQL
jgi:hypothetical protein